MTGGPSDQRRVWDAIAASFDRTRPDAWPHVVEFLRDLPPHSRLLDVMAGNGRHCAAAAALGHHATWLDWSAAAARLAAPRFAGDVVVADAVHLPFASASFDAVLMVAALHGLETEESRAGCLREIHRVLRPGGCVQVTVWSRTAPRFAALDLPPGPVDVKVPWRGDGLQEDRFYHLFTPDELRAAVTSAGFSRQDEAAVAIAADRPDNLVVVARAGQSDGQALSRRPR